jgi:SAM-dependent methyltransferase
LGRGSVRKLKILQILTLFNTPAMQTLDPNANQPGMVEELPSRLVGRLHILECTKCRGFLDHVKGALVCQKCKTSFSIREGKIYFDTPPRHETAEAGIKERFKKVLGTKYNLVVNLVAPIYPFSVRKVIVAHIDPARNLVVDVGAGARRVHPDIITLDLFDYDTVDIVCSVDRLPFAPNSVDGFVSLAVIEHLSDPFALVESLHRATRTGGVGVHDVPFMYHFHESPRDFMRFTHMGLRLLFKRWNVVRLFNTAGPFSLALASGVEIIASLLSFGNGRVKELIYLGVCGLTFPIKFLDWPFVNKQGMFSIAPGFCIVVAKSE